MVSIKITSTAYSNGPWALDAKYLTKITICIFFWFFFTTYSNVYSKKYLADGGDALLLSQLSFLIAFFVYCIMTLVKYVLPNKGPKYTSLKLSNAPPKMKFDFWGVVKYLSPIALLHIGNTLLTNLSMGAADIKFTYTVKVCIEYTFLPVGLFFVNNIVG